MEQCKICKKKYKSISGLNIHVSRTHKNVESYYLSFIGDKGYCAECGKETKFKSIAKGYNLTCSKECQSAHESKSRKGTSVKDKMRKDGKTEDEIKIYMSNKSIFSDSYYKKRNIENNVSEVQSANGKKYGEKLKSNPEKYKASFTTRIAYWEAQGLSTDEAKKVLAKRQSTFSKDICISKYGKVEGIAIWKERQQKWQNTLNAKSDEEKKRINKLKDSHSMSYYLSHGYTEDEAKVLRAERMKKINTRTGFFSKESIKFFDSLFSFLEDDGFLLEQSNILIGDNELQLFANNRSYFYDLTFLEEKLIIEYDGTAWHPDPTMSDDELKAIFVPFANINMLEQKQRDNDKQKIAENLGYTVIRIYAAYQNKLEIFNNIKNILNDKHRTSRTRN